MEITSKTNGTSISCEHDWRVDPRFPPAYSPIRVTVECAKCRVRTIAPFHFKPKEKKDMSNPYNWKRYTGEVSEVQ